MISKLKKWWRATVCTFMGHVLVETPATASVYAQAPGDKWYRYMHQSPIVTCARCHCVIHGDMTLVICSETRQNLAGMQVEAGRFQ